MARILVVDDSPSTRATLVDLLEFHGHEVVGEAADGRACLELSRQTRPDLILLDLSMPESDGFFALEQMREEGIDVAVLAITALSSSDRHRQAIDLGARAVVLKPYEIDELMEQIDASLKS